MHVLLNWILMNDIVYQEIRAAEDPEFETSYAKNIF